MSENQPIDFALKSVDAIEAAGSSRTTNHDILKMARNILGSNGFPFLCYRDYVGHKVHLGVQSHYLDYDYLYEQREAYENWSRKLAEAVRGDRS